MQTWPINEFFVVCTRYSDVLSEAKIKPQVEFTKKKETYSRYFEEMKSRTTGF